MRKRPIFRSEERWGEIDAVTCLNPKVIVHETKYKVDGITKQLINNEFTLDNWFSEYNDSEGVYKYTLAPLMDFMSA